MSSQSARDSWSMSTSTPDAPAERSSSTGGRAAQQCTAMGVDASRSTVYMRAPLTSGGSMARCRDKPLALAIVPDFGTITIHYVPDKLCLELKSLKMYTLAYRDLGIFQENVVNCFLRDIVKACDPIELTITGEFAPRGGLGSTMQASYTKTASKRGKRGRGY